MPENGTSVAHVPTVLWAQRNDKLFLTIAVEDIDKPEIKLEENTLYFKGYAGKQLYELSLEFFKPVDKEESKYGIYGQKHWMFIITKKEVGPYWTRLMKDSKKCHWLKADWNKWKDEDEEDEAEEGGMGGMGGMGGGQDFDSMFKQMGGLGGMGGMGGMGGLGGMGDFGDGEMPNLDDLDDRNETDSDDEKMPDLEENKGEAKPAEGSETKETPVA